MAAAVPELQRRRRERGAQFFDPINSVTVTCGSVCRVRESARLLKCGLRDPAVDSVNRSLLISPIPDADADAPPAPHLDPWSDCCLALLHRSTPFIG